MTTTSIASHVNTHPTQRISTTLKQCKNIAQRISALQGERDELLERLLSDLAWMDIPVRRLGGLGVLELLPDPALGTRVHLVRQYAEHGEFKRVSAHLVGDCGWSCGGPGATVKGGTRQRWRYHCLGEFEYIGARESDGNPDYLFVEAQETR